MEDETKKILLTYYSSTLRQYDLNFLAPGQWLNDQLINFVMEHLSHKYLQSEPLASQVKLVDPAVVSSFNYCQNDKEDLDDIFKPLGLHKATKLVILPINDNTNPNLPSGGSHWTLLA
jgi:sentrin-specific protease 8